jgi:hypothetical protein
MIQSGTLFYGVDNSQDWTLHDGSGRRVFLPPDVRFETAFSAPPQVVLALHGVDSDHNANLRLWVEAYDIEPEEFSIRVLTHGDTLIYNVWVTWIAHDLEGPSS